MFQILLVSNDVFSIAVSLSLCEFVFVFFAFCSNSCLVIMVMMRCGDDEMSFCLVSDKYLLSVIVDLSSLDFALLL